MPDTAQFILNRLTEWGIQRVYGYPGDGINGLMGAFHEIGDRLEFIQTRHEEIASFAATAHAKFTGEVGVCMATSGPGAIHLLNGLYDAKLDHQPVVALIGQQKRMSLGANYQQEVDLNTLFKDVASEYLMTIMDPTQARHVIDRAVRIAKSSRSVTAVIVPEDVQEAEHSEPPRAHGAVYSSLGFSTPMLRPRDADLQRAAEILNTGEKVAMLIGQGAAHAQDEVVEVAELLGAGVAKALNGRAALPDDLPFVTGSIGLLGTKPSYDMMMGCDTLLIVGSSFPYAEWLPEEGSCRAVQIDIDGRLLGMRYAPTEANLVGDSKDTLQALIPLLQRKPDRSWREMLEGEIERWWRLMDERAHLDAQPINPQLVFAELSPRLPDGCILTSDSGSATNWWARHVRLRKGDADRAVGHAGHDVPGGALRAGSQVRQPRPTGHRLPGRWGNADARQRRANRPRPLRRALAQQAVHRDRAPQRRSQPGHLGAARDGRRPQAPGLPGATRLPVRPLRRDAGNQGDPRRAARGGSPGLGRGPGPHERSRPLRGDHRPRGAAAAAAHPV